MIENSLKNLAWNTFKKTGNINTFMELKQMQEIELKNIEDTQNGNYKNQGNNNFRK